ncbi:hypothetical protein LZ30DRAFT_809132 [Colletotrichum cereale]|nr:hypothetical protein LZ30DRAFT_809132 [Colletotrichum cereale]
MSVPDCTNLVDFVTYVEFIRVCVEGEGYSMALTWLLLKSVEQTPLGLTDAHGSPTKPSEWSLLLKEVRLLANIRKRTAQFDSFYAI